MNVECHRENFSSRRTISHVSNDRNERLFDCRVICTSSKLADDIAEEQLSENASLRTILQWYERHIYRNLYLPLFQNETDTTIKCVRIYFIQKIERFPFFIL